MQTRQELRKNNNRNNLYLIIATAVVVLIVILGFVFYHAHVQGQARARNFARNHFNPNVQIYGVNVGKMTVAAATKAVNQHADNHAVLQQRKVKVYRNPNKQTIKQSQVAAYFNQQHTAMPNNKSYRYENKKLVQAQKDLKQLDKAQLTYRLPKKSYQLKAANLIGKATFDGKKIKFDKIENLKAKLKQMDRENGTLKQSYQFAVPSGNKVKGKTITVKNQSYGWGINQKPAIKAIEQAFIKQTKTIDGEDYIYGLGYSTYGLGYNKANHGIGDNYVVVSLKDQEIWVIRKGKVAVHLDDVVTGTRDGGKGDATPEGVWYIMYKESPSTLRGFNDDGSRYSSKVHYWMPFTLSGCGLHDASWRTDWSKTAYLKGGSHGCVNIRPSEIASVWHAVIKHEAVIVY
jgi:hypothetical protein